MTVNKITKQLAIVCLITFLILEIAFRAFYLIKYDLFVLDGTDLVQIYYPELATVEAELSAEPKAKTRILIAGGSVVWNQLCNVDSLSRAMGITDRSYFSVAQPAHTSLDSKYKFERLAHQRFDYVFVYHGINETRTNNCPPELFDPDYRHIEFYNDLFVLNRHPELTLTVIPFTLDLMIQKLKIKFGWKKVIPREYNVLSYFHDKQAAQNAWWKYGKEVKSKEAMANNLNEIVDRAAEYDTKVLLSTYAFYLPPDYELQSFIDHELDYGKHSWPVEIYGDPLNVVKGIQAHNSMVAQIADTKSVALIDMAANVPGNKRYFDDICHLSSRGCRYFVQALNMKFDELEEKRK